MDSPDVIGDLLRKLVKHKQKPVQFSSVAQGVQRRLISSLQGRRNSRLTLFDSIRNLPTCVSPDPKQLAPMSEAQQKVKRRRQQKKEQAAKKKMPFRTGVAPKPLALYVPPPPVPTTSRRVTRPQTAKHKVSKQASDPNPANAVKSLASFRPPEIKHTGVAPKTLELYVPPPPVPTTSSGVTGPQAAKNYVSKQASDPKPAKAVESLASFRPLEIKHTGVAPKTLELYVPPPPVPTTSRGVTGSQAAKNYVSKQASDPKPAKAVESLASFRPPEIKHTGVAPKKLELYVPPPPEPTTSRGVTGSQAAENYVSKQASDPKPAKAVESLASFRPPEIKHTGVAPKTLELYVPPPPVPNTSRGVTGPQAAKNYVSKQASDPKPAKAIESLASFRPPEIKHRSKIPIRIPVSKSNVVNKKKIPDTRDWADKPQAAPASRVSRLPIKRPSRLREMIAAARIEKKESEEQPTATPEKQPKGSKTFEAFFCVKSPVRRPAPVTPSKEHNLLKASASQSLVPFAMLRASSISRNLEDGMQTPLNPINFSPPGGRSILHSNSGKKPFEFVLFVDEIDNDDAQKTGPPKNHISEVHTDSGQYSLDDDFSSSNEHWLDWESKVTPKRKSRLTRHDAISNNYSGVMTRSQRKSIQSPHTEEKSEKNGRSSNRKPLQDVNVQGDVEVPKRSTSHKTSNM